MLDVVDQVPLRKILETSQENICGGVFFQKSYKDLASKFAKKKNVSQMFLLQVSDFFPEHQGVAVSGD